MPENLPPTFTELGLIAPLLKSLETEGYERPTPIQAQAIPHLLEGRDLLGVAQTGTGKTAAFALPILQLLSERPVEGARKPIRSLILTPTRELAAQIAESFDRYGAQLGLSNTVVFGGVGQAPQVSALRRGVDILVATPGRLLDLIDQRHVDLRNLEIFVLDEADRMLDMGFIHDVRRVIAKLPQKRHSLFFSATMPPDIQKLARDILTDPVKVEVTPVSSTAEKIEQSVYFIEKADKRYLLTELLKDPAIERVLVFTRTKHGADRVAKILNQARIPADAIHGNKSQNNRTRALDAFKGGELRVLVATDIAARGIDIDGITHVINYELPNIPESYVHRIGRTARAGREGTAFSFCDAEERSYLRDIERLIRMKITVASLPGEKLRAPSEVDAPPPHLRQGRQGNQGARHRQATRGGGRPGGHGGHGGGGRHGGGGQGRGGRPGARSEGRGHGGERPARAEGGERRSRHASGGARPEGPQHARSDRPQQHGRPERSGERPHGGGGQQRHGGKPAHGKPAHKGEARHGGGQHGHGRRDDKRGDGHKGARGGHAKSDAPKASPAGEKKPWWKKIITG